MVGAFLSYIVLMGLIWQGGNWGHLENSRVQGRVLLSCGWKSRHGRSQSHVAWMAGGDGNVAFWSPSTKSA